MSKREAVLEIRKQFNEKVRMTYASGDDQCVSKGFSVSVKVFKRDEESKYTMGCWEICSDDSSCYGEGTLTFDSANECIDYDGCYDLSHHVCDILKLFNYGTKQVDSRLFD